MEFIDIQHVIAEAQSHCLAGNIPFFSYRKPGEEMVFGAQISGNDVSCPSSAEAFLQEGFLLVPFNMHGSDVPVFIRGEINTLQKRTLDLKALSDKSFFQEDSCFSVTDVTFEMYRRQIENMTSYMRQGKLNKAVLSRTITLNKVIYDDVVPLFFRLAEQYPEAFVFLVSTGKYSWIGATPETFFSKNETGFFTMALAGTRKTGTKGEWGEKELEEQRIVTDYIYKAITDIGITPEVEGPFSRNAGPVEHLCTTFKGYTELSFEQAAALVGALHPTPAVGGFPKGEAIRLILEQECHDRRYYGGYLGPLHGNGCFDLFVNLRSMEFNRHQVRLYIGGGITAQSEPLSEWNETVAKSRTLLDMIK